MNLSTTQASEAGTLSNGLGRVGPEPFTWGTLAGIGGASAAVTTISGTLSAAFNWQYPGWVPLALALLIVIVADFSVRRTERAKSLKNPQSWLLWLLNACLVFMTAVGGSRLITANEPQTAAVAQERSASLPADDTSPTPSETVQGAVPGPGESIEQGSSTETPSPGTEAGQVVPQASSAPATSSQTPAVHPAKTTLPRVASSAAPSASASAPKLATKPTATAVSNGVVTATAPTAAKRKATEAPLPKAEMNGFRRLGNISLF